MLLSTWLLLLLVSALGQCAVEKVVVQLRESTLECRCNDVRKPQIVWRQGSKILNNRDKNGNQVFLDPRMSLAHSVTNAKAGVFDLLINPVYRNDSGSYSCIIFDLTDANPRPQRCNQTFFVTVVSRPQRLVALNSTVVVKESKQELLQCTAVGGYPAPKQVQWFDVSEQSGSTLVQSTNQTAFPNGTLVSTLLVVAPNSDNVKGKYKKKYRCAVEQRDLTDVLEQDISSNGFYLHQIISVDFHYPPRIVSLPMPLDGVDREFMENETVTFRCDASDAYPTDYSWFWSNNGRTMENSRTGDEKFSNFRLQLTREHHAKILSCTVCVSSGCQSANYTLRVKFPPKVTIEPAKAVAELGQQGIRFDCLAEGNPSPLVTWFNEAGIAVRKGGGDLQINSVRKADFGTYTCLASANSNGLDWSDRAEAYLLEKTRPVILNPLREQHAVLSSSVMLTCDVASATETTVWWHKDGLPVTVNSENGRFATAKEARLDSTLHILTIANLEKSDFGQYNCTVGNEKGNVSSVVTLRHRDEMPFMAIVIATLAALFTLLILVIAVVACKRSKLSKNGAYRSNSGSSSSSNNEKLVKQVRARNAVLVQAQNGRPISTAVRDEAETASKFLNDEYFPPFIEMDRGAYIRYESEPNGEGINNNNNNPSIHDYNALMTLRGRMGNMTPTGTYCNGCSVSCTGNSSACRKVLNNGSDLLTIIPQQFHHHPSVLRFNEDVEEIVPKEDGGSSYDSGFATSQTLAAANGTGAMVALGGNLLALGPTLTQRVTNIDSIITTLPMPAGMRTPSPAVHDFIAKPSVSFAANVNVPVASTV